MQKQPPSSFCAVAAIAAALALGSTAAQAQDAGPAPNVPTIAPPAPTVPAAAAPAPAPSAQVSTPVVQPVPIVAPPEPAAQQAPAARTATRPEAGTARPSPRTTAARPAASTASSVPAAAVVPTAATPPPAAAPAPAPALDPVPRAEPAPATQPQLQSDGLSGAESGLLALLAAGGLAGAGFMAARSRRRRDEDEMAETEVVADRAAVIPVVAPEPVVQRQPEPRPEPAAPRVALPTGEIPTGAEREELLRRMVAAPPDEANPFTSPRARRKRACLILQHRVHLQAQGTNQDDGAKPFDWRTYRPAQTAARVDEPA